MGGDHSTSHSQQFRKQDWQVTERSQFSLTWQHRRDPSLKLQQHNIFSSTEEDYQHEKDIFGLRKEHFQLVAAPFLESQSSSDFCSSSYQQKLYVEKIPIRLSDIEHIPFPDFLHLYAQSLKGYQVLAERVGPFVVQEEFIGINQRGVAKVWMNPDFSKSTPLGVKVTQEAMVRSIIEMIDRNLDPSQVPQQIPSVRNYIYRRSERVLFGEAINELHNFARDFNQGQIPAKLDCIDRVGGIQTIANRDKVFQTAQNVVPIGRDARYFQSNPVVQQGRSQLVDSQINSYFRPNNSQRYFEAANNLNGNGQVVQNTQAPVLAFPGENVEVPRKQSFPIYGNEVVSQTQISQVPQFAQLPQVQPSLRMQERPVNSMVNAPSIPQPNVVYTQQNNIVSSGYRQVKVGEASPQPLQQQIYSSVQVNPSQIPQNIQVAQNVQYNPNAASNLLNMVSNQTRPIIRMPEEPKLPFLSYQQYQQDQVIVPPTNPPQPQQAPNQPPVQVQQSINSTVAPNTSQSNGYFFNSQSTYAQPNSTTLPQVSASSSSTNYANNNISSVLNQGNPTVIEPAINPNTFSFQPQPQNTFGSNINIDDGKSSLDFFKKLNEINNFDFQMKGVKYPPEPTETIQETIDFQPYKYSNPFSNSGYASELVQRVSEPLKENTYDQIYSSFQRPSNQPSYTYQQYQSNQGVLRHDE